MSGKLCSGAVTNNSYLPQESKAFSEGIYHRAQGTAVAYPVTDNPHAAASSAGVAWIAGWTVANDAAGGTITASDAPCVAVPTNTISV